MQYVLLVLLSLVAYSAGVFILLRVTPMLLHRRYDEGFFMGVAALDIVGGICVFGGVILPLLLFSGSLGIRIFAVFFLLGIFFVAIRLLRGSLRPRANTFAVSRAIASIYSLFILAGAIYCLVLTLIPSR